MADATAGFKVKTKDHPVEMIHHRTVTSGKQLYQGILVGTDASGNLLPASDALCVQVLGWSMDTVLGDGTLKAHVKQGLGSALADAGSPPTIANFGQLCYVKDDQTVSMDPSVGLPAGQVYEIDAVTGAVYFLSGFGVPGVTGSAKRYLTLAVADLVAADAKVYRVASPVKGKITKVWASLGVHAIAAADCTITGKIAGAAITGGVVTLPVAGSAIGATASATPSAANSVVPGSDINFTVGGGNTDATAVATLVIEITSTP